MNEPGQSPAALLHRKEIRSVVVFRALQLGDMLCAVPALRALRAGLPDARITLVGLRWAAQFAARFRHYLDDFVAFPGHPDLPEQGVHEAALSAFYAEMHQRRFDLALQLHGSGQISNGIVSSFGARTMAGFAAQGAARVEGSGYHFLDYPDQGPEVLRLLQLTSFLGAPHAGTHLEFPVHAPDLDELARSKAGTLAPGGYICVHPGARWRDKCWPPALFAQVADAIASEWGPRIVLTGSPQEADLTAEVARHMRQPALDTAGPAGPLSLGAMAALMRGARLLLSNDTGVSHIAAALGLPSVIVFSKADMRRWSPLDAVRHRCLWDPRGEHVGDVLRHATELLQEASPLPASLSA